VSQSIEQERAITATTTTSIRPSLDHVTMKTNLLGERIEWYGFVLGAYWMIPYLEKTTRTNIDE